MLYDLSNPLDIQQARTRLEALIKRSATIDLCEKKPKRTLNQNAYLHLLLGYFASQTGNTLEWVKREYYKKICNPDLYIAERSDTYAGMVKFLRSSSELTTEQMTLTIERFRNWSANEAGIYLPEPTNSAEIQAAQIEVERYKTYLY